MTNCMDIRQDNVDFLLRIFRGGYRDLEIYDLLVQNLTLEEGEKYKTNHRCRNLLLPQTN